MSANTDTLRLPADLAQDLAALDKRSRLLLTKGKLAAGVSLTAAAGAAIAYGWAHLVEPSAALSAVHVPPEVLGLFSDAVGGHPPWESVASYLTGFLTGWFPKILACLAVLIGAVSAAFTGNMKHAIMPALMAVPLLLLPSMMGSLLGTDQGQESERAVFLKFAEDANRDALAKMLDKVDVALDGRQYVLAQAAIARAHKEDGKITGEGLGALRQHVAAVQLALANGTKMTFDGGALYALDVNATGQARTPLAQRYYKEATESAQAKRATAGSLGSSALLFGAAAGALLLVGRRMRHRVDRLQSLVGPTTSAVPAAKASDRPTEQPAPQQAYGRSAPSKRRLRDEDTNPVQTTTASSTGSLLGVAAAGLGAALVVDALTDNERSDATEAPLQCNRNDEAPDVASSCDYDSASAGDSSSDPSDSGGSDGGSSD